MKKTILIIFLGIPTLLFGTLLFWLFRYIWFGIQTNPEQTLLTIYSLIAYLFAAWTIDMLLD